jgi:lipoate-protein ligase A
MNSSNTKGKQSKKTEKVVVERAYFVKTHEKKIVTAYKRPNGYGYVYHRKGPDGIVSVSINGPVYKTEKKAKEELEKLKK